ncbi:hypothetical protein REH65_11945 [Saccharopolyspora sp. ID03-671]|uniref:hypothetical protein n=1 Tax=Saccharopolyspora sp. ID03-671 TaxID=3073066 RepID=UPI00324A6AAC
MSTEMKADFDRRLDMENAFPNRGSNINDHAKIVMELKLPIRIRPGGNHHWAT